MELDSREDILKALDEIKAPQKLRDWYANTPGATLTIGDLAAVLSIQNLHGRGTGYGFMRDVCTWLHEEEHQKWINQTLEAQKPSATAADAPSSTTGTTRAAG